jgi:hypothetical protein
LETQRVTKEISQSFVAAALTSAITGITIGVVAVNSVAERKNNGEKGDKEDDEKHSKKMSYDEKQSHK